MGSRRKAVIDILLFLWVPLVIAAYFVVHKPWEDSSLLALWGVCIDLAICFMIILVAGGVGNRLSGGLAGLDPFERIAVQGGLGIGTLGIVVLILGSFGLVGPALWAGLIIAMVVFGRHGLRWLAHWRHLGTSAESMGWIGRPAAILTILLVGASLLEALAPPLKWDSLVYHLELPKQYLQMGHIGFVPNNLFVGFPQNAEMVHTLAMALGQGTSAATVGWAVGILGLAGVAGLARRTLGPESFWVAPALLLSGASLWQGLAWAYVDQWVLLFGVGLFSCLDQLGRSESTRSGWLVTAGALLGLALGTKYTAGILAAGGAAMVAMEWGRRKEGVGSNQAASDSRSFASSLRTSKLVAGDLAVFLGVAAIVASPWLLRNLLLTGNAIHPFLFPGREVDSLRQMYQAQPLPQQAIASAALLPWRATVLGIEGGSQFNTSLGPFYLAFIPGLLLGIPGRARTSLRRFVIVALVVWVIWAVASNVADPLSRSRHYYGFLPVLAILATAGLISLGKSVVYGVNVGWVTERLTLFAFALTGLASAVHLGQLNPLPVVTGAESPSSYISEELGWFGPVMNSINGLPPGSVVRFLWEPRAYYCTSICVPDVILDQWWYLSRKIGSPEAIASEWRESGVSHVLVYDLGVRLEMEGQPLLTEGDWANLARFREQELDLLQTFGSAYSLYEMR